LNEVLMVLLSPRKAPGGDSIERGCVSCCG